jgi:AraC family ethanolamine operon transcriptional activator
LPFAGKFGNASERPHQICAIWYPQEDAIVQAQRAVFGDFDQLSAALSGWQLDWRQLEAGGLRASSAQLASSETLLTHVSFNRRFLQRGATPPGMRTFGFVHPGLEPRVVAWGQPMYSSSILPFPESYEATSSAGYSAHTIAVREDAIREAAAEVDRERELELVLRMNSPIACRPAEFRALCEAADAVVFGTGEISTSAQAAALEEELDHALPRLLVRALTSHGPGSSLEPAVPRGDRRAVARRARAFIEEHAEEPPTIQEICRNVGASRRTLEYAMREQIGVSPKTYLQATRLQGVRRDLAEAVPGTRVADVAGAWGFWHMGQFARDYRHWFGELPSATLAAALCRLGSPSSNED